LRLAALYDIHGNLPALETVLGEVQRDKVDRIIVGGDVLPGPMPRETLHRLLHVDLPVDFIHGNGDRETLAAFRGEISSAVPEQFREVLSWSAHQLHDDDVKFIAGWPLTLRLNIGGLGEVLFCHATPRNDTEIFSAATPESKLLPIFQGLNASVVVCGHTHMQFDRMIGKTRVVNAGSVGMPFGEPGAYWLLLGLDVFLRRTTYDVKQAADRVRATAYPQAADFAARNIVQVPAAADVLAMYKRAELGCAG
jgi:predicted phosphodiesterase